MTDQEQSETPRRQSDITGLILQPPQVKKCFKEFTPTASMGTLAAVCLTAFVEQVTMRAVFAGRADATEQGKKRVTTDNIVNGIANNPLLNQIFKGNDVDGFHPPKLAKFILLRLKENYNDSKIAKKKKDRLKRALKAKKAKESEKASSSPKKSIEKSKKSSGEPKAKKARVSKKKKEESSSSSSSSSEEEEKKVKIAKKSTTKKAATSDEKSKKTAGKRKSKAKEESSDESS